MLRLIALCLLYTPAIAANIRTPTDMSAISITHTTLLISIAGPPDILQERQNSWWTPEYPQTPTPIVPTQTVAQTKAAIPTLAKHGGDHSTVHGSGTTKIFWIVILSLFAAVAILGTSFFAYKRFCAKRHQT